jgi:hypothetical protein
MQAIDVCFFVAWSLIHLLGVIIGIAQMIRLLQFRIYGSHSVGEVVRIAESRGGRGGVYYHTTLCYIVAGASWQVTIVSQSRYHVGETVPVYYFRAQPGDGQVCSIQEWTEATVKIVGMGCMSAGGILGIIWSIRSL